MATSQHRGQPQIQFKGSINISRGSSHCSSVVMNLTSIHEDVGSIPGLTQWVKDPALPWLWCRPVATAAIRPPTPGTFICLGCSPKKAKKKNISWMNVNYTVPAPCPSALGLPDQSIHVLNPFLLDSTLAAYFPTHRYIRGWMSSVYLPLPLHQPTPTRFENQV